MAVTRVPAIFNARFVARHFFPEKYPNQLRAINGGECYDFAWLCFRLFPGVQLWSSDWHAWVELQGKFFDSEALRGVTDYLDLPFHKRNREIYWDEQEPRSMDLTSFKALWDSVGIGRRCHWEGWHEHHLKRVLGKRYRETTPILDIANDPV
jgi:hypothetical protein